MSMISEQIEELRLIAEMSADAIVMLSKKAREPKQGEWIPCSEGLPSENGTYIVTEKRFAIDDRNHQGKYQTLVEEVDFRDGRWNRAKFFEVVAWQQRPEPWKGADDE